MPARFLKAAIPTSGSVYQNLPLDFINQKISADQAKLDLTNAKLGELNAQPLGLETVQDELGNLYQVPDYQKAVEWSGQFNQSVEDAINKLYRTGDVSGAAALISNLNKQYTQAQSQEGILGRNKLRQEAYTKLHEGLSKVKNLPNSYWRSIPYISELGKIQSDPNYIPSADVAYAEHVDRIEKTNKIMTGIADELFGDPYAFSNGKYIYEGKKYGVTEDKIKKTFEAGLFGDPELKNDIDTQIEYNYFRDKPNEDYNTYYQKEFNKAANDLLNVALKNKKTMGDKSMKGDPYGQVKYEYDLNNPSLPIGGYQGSFGVKGQSFTEWKKSLDNRTVAFDDASQNTRNIGLNILNTLGIKDPNAINSLITNRKNFTNPDGSLNVQAVEKAIDPTGNTKLNQKQIIEATNGLALYNQALDVQNKIQVEQDNIKNRIDDLNKTFITNSNDKVNKEYEYNKDIYNKLGINSGEQLMNQLVEANTKGLKYLPALSKFNSIEEAGVTPQAYNEVSRFFDNFKTDLDKHYQNNSFSESYLIMDNANEKTGEGQYNTKMTEFFRSDPTKLLDLKADGQNLTVRDILKNNNINLSTVDFTKINIKMIGNPMIDGSTGMMVSIVDKTGKKIVDVPASDNGMFADTRVIALNDSYYNLATNPTSSAESDIINANRLRLAKGTTVAGSQLNAVEMNSLEPNQSVTIYATSGRPYTITKISTGGYTLETPGISPITKLMDRNATLEGIGEIEFFMDATNLKQ